MGGREEGEERERRRERVEVSRWRREGGVEGEKERREEREEAYRSQ